MTASRLLPALLAVSCGPGLAPKLPDASAFPADTAERQGDSAADTAPDTAEDTAGDTAGDTADTGSAPAACPADMVGVPTASPGYCIDRYEGSLSAGGDQLRSAADVLPSVALTFEEARALCAATPVLDADGVEVGHKRLATWTEWRDAADGVVGEGGSTYPTGEEWPARDCAVPDEEGVAWLTELQPTGAFVDCVSAVGTFDQLGNAWEWADPEIDVDINAFVVDQAAASRTFTVDADGLLTLLDGSFGALKLEVPGLQGSLVADEAGVVSADATFQADEPFDYHGFIIDYSRETTATGWMLPVDITRVDGAPSDGQAPLRVRVDVDGSPLTAKVGCAWYVGQPDGCRLSERFVGHPHDFQGTIGARCAADPL